MSNPSDLSNLDANVLSALHPEGFKEDDTNETFGILHVTIW